MKGKEEAEAQPQPEFCQDLRPSPCSSPFPRPRALFLFPFFLLMRGPGPACLTLLPYFFSMWAWPVCSRVCGSSSYFFPSSPTWRLLPLHLRRHVTLMWSPALHLFFFLLYVDQGGKKRAPSPWHWQAAPLSTHSFDPFCHFIGKLLDINVCI